MAWLSDYSKRIKLSIDNTNVDGDLSDFPILVPISASAGKDDQDISAVFDELTSDGNRKKIAVTTEDETTQCYVEIERWDDANEKAELWIKVPTVVSGTTTDLYLYYDSTQSDNTAYIGDTGDSPAQSVWDSNFKLVMHMAQDPNGDVADAIKDSTSNANHGTPGGSMTTADLVDGKVGKAIDFDGSGDHLNNANFLNTSALTVSCIVNITADDAWFINKRDAASDNQWQLINYDGILRATIYDGGVSAIGVIPDGTTVVNDGYREIGFTTTGVNGGDLILYRDGISNGTPGTLSGDMKIGARELCIGKRSWSSAGFVDGIIDEIRISNTVRSPAWNKATYYSNWDELVSFGSEEICMTLTFTNPTPVHLSTVYGTTEQLQLTTTVSGDLPNYTYNATFYDEYDVQIGTTIYGVNSGSQAVSNTNLSTPSGINYNWYVIATSSGAEDTSPTYTFSNRFLYEGYVTEKDIPANRVVRLYYRNTGELIDTTTSSGGGGYYKLSAINNDEHFIVAFDDEAGKDYNALILDRLLPNGE